MFKLSASPAIRLRGVRQNNLKNFDLDLPLKQLIVITGLSGSGKSSLAFDTLFAEGQRRYIETFSPYARQFFDRMDKPKVDRIEGIPPAIALEQRNSVKTTRSTVGTMTEICDYMKVLWPHVAQLHCRSCGKPVMKEPPGYIWETLNRKWQDRDLLLTFELPLSEKLSLQDSLQLLARQGYQRLLSQKEVVRLENLPLTHELGALTVVQDRFRMGSAARARFVEACEQAYHFGKGKLCIFALKPGTTTVDASTDPLHFSRGLHCATCDIEYREASPALFSFNNPIGACPACKGFGRVIGIDYRLALPDASRTIREGVVKPWQTGQSAECQTDLLDLCRKKDIPTNVPFRELPQKWQDLILDGDPDYGSDEQHEWPRAWYGVKGYFRWLESRTYKMHVRVLLSRYRAYNLCPDCKGMRLKPDALLYRTSVGNLSIAEFYQLTAADALRFLDSISSENKLQANKPVRLALQEVHARLEYLVAVGLGYLTLDRPTRSLSGGETQRVNLTACLGTRLVNTLFVLDEPSVGLHPRDTERLVRILEQLRNAGNTVVVVEHEPAVMRAADMIVDLGPGHGASGGAVVFQGSYEQILHDECSLTGAYLSGRKQVPISLPRPAPSNGNVHERRSSLAERSSNARVLELREAIARISKRAQSSQNLSIRNATRHNLRHLDLDIPLHRLVCITGVSGSGKSTLVRDLLLPALCEKLKGPTVNVAAADRLQDTPESEDERDDCDVPLRGSIALSGWQGIKQVILVEQSVLGKTPRSNPAVYIGAFDAIRKVFASTPAAQEKNLPESAFSFNSRLGQCERCRGAGFEKIEMQFLSDIFIRCPDCDGRRYRSEMLEVKVSPPVAFDSKLEQQPALSIADLLESTVDEALIFLSAFDTRAAVDATSRLRWLQEVGLGYLRLGQPINTLSGGESQRLKLVRHLAEIEELGQGSAHASTLFLFDEPTTGLHYEDVAVLLKVFQRIVDAGHSVLIIEHNLEVIKTADWVIDLGPEAGDLGGQVVVEGTPEEVAACEKSHTGRALREVLRSPTASRAAPANRRPVRARSFGC